MTASSHATLAARDGRAPSSSGSRAGDHGPGRRLAARRRRGRALPYSRNRHAAHRRDRRNGERGHVRTGRVLRAGAQAQGQGHHDLDDRHRRRLRRSAPPGDGAARRRASVLCREARAVARHPRRRARRDHRDHPARCRDRGGSIPAACRSNCSTNFRRSGDRTASTITLGDLTSEQLVELVFEVSCRPARWTNSSRSTSPCGRAERPTRWRGRASSGASLPWPRWRRRRGFPRSIVAPRCSSAPVRSRLRSSCNRAGQFEEAEQIIERGARKIESLGDDRWCAGRVGVARWRAGSRPGAQPRGRRKSIHYGSSSHLQRPHLLADLRASLSTRSRPTEFLAERRLRGRAWWERPESGRARTSGRGGCRCRRRRSCPPHRRRRRSESGTRPAPSRARPTTCGTRLRRRRPGSGCSSRRTRTRSAGVGAEEVRRVELPRRRAERAERGDEDAVARELLHAVVVVLGDEDVAFGADRDAGRVEELSRPRSLGAPRAQERSGRIEHLHAMVRVVGDEDVPAVVERDVVGRPELARTGARRAPARDLRAARRRGSRPGSRRPGARRRCATARRPRSPAHGSATARGTRPRA